ncbi:MAG: hypothetical protein KDI36_15975, partial [Pseudomonadales bacterium]|nr:hypothetical protein [Pseudomonadales bacterium]
MYQLVFLLLFDAMLVMTLAHYYRHLGHRYLRYGAMALGAEMLVQTAAHLSYFFPDYDAFFYLSQIARAGFATCILLAVGAVVSVRVARVPLFCGWVLLPAGFVFSLIFTTDRTLGWQATNIPSLWLLLYATFLLGMDERKRTPGILWLTGLTMLHITLLSVLPYILSIEMLFQLLYIVNAMVVILMGFSLVLITSENSVSDLVQQNSRIQEFMREKEQLELQFTEAQKLESLGVLAGGIAHDFNNMLTSILGYASLAMKKLPDDSETRKDLYMVMSGARQAVELTSQMLIYAGKGTLEFEPVDLSRVVDNMSSLVNSIVPRKIAVETKLGNELPVVRGDR